MQNEAERLLSAHGVDAEVSYLVRLCIEELVSNVIRHGFNAPGEHQIDVTVDVLPASVNLTIDDDGKPFDPNGHPDLQAPGSLEEAPTGGMGLSLVRHLVGPIEYTRIKGRNHATVRIPRPKVGA